MYYQWLSWLQQIDREIIVENAPTADIRKILDNIPDKPDEEAIKYIRAVFENIP